MSKRFWGGWFGASKRLSLEDLHHQYATLLKHPVVNEANRAVVVETIRSIAEFMIWGDQNEPKVFEFFLENNVMVYLHNILLQPANRRGDVAKQVLQTLSIIIQNVKSQTGIFFLFSNNHINNIVELEFDFEDEEVLGYYVSFLKTISLKLNPGTVQFFFNRDADQRHNFPLYSEATKLAHHKEGMVRAAVRTLTLNIYCVQDASIQDFIVTPPASQYFADVAGYVAEQILSMDKRMAAAEGGHSVTALSALDSQLAELEDMLTYCSDVFSNAPRRACDMLSEQLWQHLSAPLLLSPLLECLYTAPLPAGPAGAAGAATGFSSPKSHGLLNAAISLPSPGGTQTKTPQRVRASCALYAMERIFSTIAFPPLLHHLLLGIFLLSSAHSHPPSDPPSPPAPAPAAPPPGPPTPARDILSHLVHTADPRTSSATLRLLISVLQNKQISPGLLSILGLLPPARLPPARDPPDLTLWVNTITGLLSAFPSPASPTDFSIPASPAQLPATPPRFLQYDDRLGEMGGGPPGSGGDPSAPLRVAPGLSQLTLQPSVPEEEGEGAEDDSGARPPGSLPQDEPPSCSSPSGAAAAAAALPTPRRVRQQRQLIQQQQQHKPSPIKSPRSPATPGGKAVDAVLQLMMDDLEQTLDVQSARDLARQLHGGLLLDTLLGVLQQPMFPVSGLWHVGWLLHQLLAEAPAAAPATSARAAAAPTAAATAAAADGLGAADAAGAAAAARGRLLTAAQAGALVAAVDAASSQLQDELGGMWCEALFPLLNMQWPVNREGMTRPVLRPSSDSLLSGPNAYPLLKPRLPGAPDGSGRRDGGLLSNSATAALQSFYIVQRTLCLVQMSQLLLKGAIELEPAIPQVTEAGLRAADIQEGAALDITLGSALPCYVSFSPGNEKKVFFAVTGVSLRRLTSIGKNSGEDSGTTHAELVHSLPVVVLAEPSQQRPSLGVVQSVAPLMGADPRMDKNISKWLHVHVRPSVRGLLRVLKSSAVRKGGLLAAMRQLADGHWVLAFSDAERAMNAKLLVEQHAAKLRALYCEVLTPLTATACAMAAALPAAAPEDAHAEQQPQQGAEAAAKPQVSPRPARASA